jgi:hypothetical protein
MEAVRQQMETGGAFFSINIHMKEHGNHQADHVQTDQLHPKKLLFV